MKNLRKTAIFCTIAAMLCSCGTKPADKPEALAHKNELPEIHDSEEYSENELIFAYFGVVPDSTLKLIRRFNKGDHGYTVKVKQYADFVENNGVYADSGDSADDLVGSDFKTIQDFINTDHIDIISGDSFHDQTNFELLENKGGFADLYQFMADDPDVNTTTINEHILRLSEKNGCLYHLPVWYTAMTLAGDAKYVGTKENWTVDEFIEHYNGASENVTINGHLESEYVFSNFFVQDLPRYVDYENATVSFDCAEFRRLLEFCNTFPSAGSDTQPDLNLTIFVAPKMLAGFCCANDFFGDDSKTLVGFPSSDGKGAFFRTSNVAISSKTSPEKQRAAWEFIKMFVSEEYQSENYVHSEQLTENGETLTVYSEETHYPVNNKVFAEKMEGYIEGRFPSMLIDPVTMERVVDNPTREECERLVQYLDSIDRIETDMNSSPLERIVTEEVMSYLAGENSLDRCVDLIQNRTSIWISEQS